MEKGEHQSPVFPHKGRLRKQRPSSRKQTLQGFKDLALQCRVPPSPGARSLSSGGGGGGGGRAGGSFVHTLGPETWLQAPLREKEVQSCSLRGVTASASEGPLAFHRRPVGGLPFAEQKEEGERNGSRSRKASVVRSVRLCVTLLITRGEAPVRQEITPAVYTLTESRDQLTAPSANGQSISKRKRR